MKVRENNLSHSRFGVVVGLKVSKRAVIRNRLRRQIREILRNDLGKIEKRYDVMIIGKKSALEIGFKELETEIRGLFKKIGLME